MLNNLINRLQQVQNAEERENILARSIVRVHNTYMLSVRNMRNN